jgi:hypothetical protein
MRIQTFQEFWPYYLSQHSNLYCRILHFFGTTLFLLSILICFLLNGQNIIFGMALSSIILFVGTFLEPRRNPIPVLILVFAILLLSDWWIIFGILLAYSFAWISHFMIEKNRPATFLYPTWSLGADLKLWGAMCIGKYWQRDISNQWAKRNTDQRL